VVYFLAKKAYPSMAWPAGVAGIMTAIYGVLVFFEGDILMISLTLFFINASVLGLILFREQHRLIWSALAGLSFGIAALDRSNILLFVPVAIWFLAGGFRHMIQRRQLLSTAVYLTGVLFVILPFSINNYRVGRDVVLISSNAGINLFIGNNSQAPGIFAIPPGIAIRNNSDGMAEDIAEIAEKESRRKLKPSEVSRFWTEKALTFIVENPGDAFILYAKKTRLMFNHLEIPNHLGFSFFKEEIAPWLSFLFIGFWIITPLALSGIFSRYYLGITAIQKLYIAFIIIYIVSLLPFFIADRYRLPVVSFFIIFAALGLGDLQILIKKRVWKIIALQGIVFIAAYLFVNQTIVSGFNMYSRSIMAEKYMQRAFSEKEVVEEDLEKAILEYKHTIEASPDYPVPYVQLAALYEKVGWFTGAIRLLKELKELIPGVQRPAVGEEIDRLQQLHEQTGDKIIESRIPQTRFEQAVAVETDGDDQTAEKIYKWIVKKDTEHTGAWIRLSRLYLRKKDMSHAVKILEKAWRINPRNLYILQELLDVYKVSGNWKKYVESGRKLMEFAP
jgi:hypothetical protein